MRGFELRLGLSDGNARCGLGARGAALGLRCFVGRLRERESLTRLGDAPLGRGLLGRTPLTGPLFGLRLLLLFRLLAAMSCG